MPSCAADNPSLRGTVNPANAKAYADEQPFPAPVIPAQAGIQDVLQRVLDGRLRHALSLTVCIASFSAACATTEPSAVAERDVELALAAADDLEDAGRYELYRAQVTAVAAVAGEEQAASLAMRACETLRRDGDIEGARQCFADLAESSTDDEVRALARYRAGALLGSDGPNQAARDALAALIVELPRTDGARRATRMLRGWRREEVGVRAEVDWLLGLATQLELEAPPEGLPLLAEVLVEAGRILLEELENVEAAARTLQRADAAARSTLWRDDAWIWRARALDRLGRGEDALLLLDAIIASQQSSWIVGTYDSPYLDDALFERGQILVRMGREGEGLAAFDELPERVPESRLRDDAAFAAAQLRWRTGQREPLRRFVSAHPDSRFVPEARRLLGEAP